MDKINSQDIEMLWYAVFFLFIVVLSILIKKKGD